MLVVVPISLAEACQFVARHHRHHEPPRGHKFSVAVVTYTLPEEGGASLRAAGYRLIGAAGGGSWSCPSRPRVDRHPTQGKLRWEVVSPQPKEKSA